MRTLLLTGVLFSVLPNVLMADPYALSSGYTLIWLVLMYLVGGYLNKYNIAEKIKKSYAWLTIGAMIVLTFLSKFLLENFPQNIFPTKEVSDIFVSYTSPSIVLIGIALLILCSKLSFGKRTIKLIGMLTPATLGVYLIHVNQLVWDHLFKGISSLFANYSCIMMVILILGSALAIYTISTVIELLRIQLFKLLKVNKLCSAIESRVANFFQKYNKG